MTKLRLDIAYDGTDFNGWAIQPGLRTVQGELEAAFEILFRQEPGQIRVHTGGRTDAGVHARGQVAHMTVSAEQLERWDRQNGPSTGEHHRLRRINGLLKRTAPDAVVLGVREVPDAFNARYSALSRRYEYRIRPLSSPSDPLTSRYTVELVRPIDYDALRAASASLIGLRDFTTFCKARPGATAVRSLERFDWRITEDGAYAATLVADAFCHSMVRTLVGASVAVGDGRITQSELDDLLLGRTRTGILPVMPPQGLVLQEIVYPPDHEVGARADLTRARRAPIPLCGELEASSEESWAD